MFEDKNKKRNKWDKDTKDFEYIKLKEYLDKVGYDKEVIVYGYYINDLDNGKAVTIITDDCFINLPNHAVEVFESMTDEENAKINEGGLKLCEFRKHTVKRFKQETIYFEYKEV